MLIREAIGIKMEFFPARGRGIFAFPDPYFHNKRGIPFYVIFKLARIKLDAKFRYRPMEEPGKRGGFLERLLTVVTTALQVFL